MLKQYHAPRRLGGNNPHGIGTVPAGTILYLQDGVRPSGCRCPFQSVRRDPWIVVAWHNREYHRGRAGSPATTYCAGGHLATVRSLRTGRTAQVADWLLRWHSDNDFSRDN